MADRIIINNLNAQNNTRSRRGGSRTQGKKIVRCAACQGTGWRDYPVCLMVCPICHGTGKVRV